MSDTISRQAVLKLLYALPPEEATTKAMLIQNVKQMDAAQSEQDREFMKLTVRNSNGRPYYSIIFLEFDDNGIEHDFEGYSSYSLDVISDYLKKYFMSSTQPETAKRIVGKSRGGITLWYQCEMCNEPIDAQDNFCRRCGRRLIDG